MKALLLATVFLAAGSLSASAQSSTSPSTPRRASSGSNVSAATHCRNASGQVQLKTASSGSGTSSSGTSSMSGGTTSGSGSLPSGSSSTGSASSAPAPGSSIAATLPPC